MQAHLQVGQQEVEVRLHPPRPQGVVQQEGHQRSRAGLPDAARLQARTMPERQPARLQVALIQQDVNAHKSTAASSRRIHTAVTAPERGP